MVGGALREGVGFVIAVNILFISNLINKIVPGTIKKFAKTNLLPLMEMDNIQLYLKVFVPSGVVLVLFF